MEIGKKNIFARTKKYPKLIYLSSERKLIKLYVVDEK